MGIQRKIDERVILEIRNKSFILHFEDRSKTAEFDFDDAQSIMAAVFQVLRDETFLEWLGGMLAERYG